MTSRNRDTARFSEMDDAMRRLGSWEPHPIGDGA